MAFREFTRFFASEGDFEQFGVKTFAVKTEEGYTIHTEVPATEETMEKVLGCHVIGDPTDEAEKSIEATRRRYLQVLYRGKVVYDHVTDANDPINKDILSAQDSFALETYIDSLNNAGS